MFFFYKNSKFQIELTSEDFDDGINDFLKEIYIYYRPEFNSWIVPEDRVEELLLWLERYKYKYIFQDSAKERLEKIRKSYTREIEIYRDRKFDRSILNDNIIPCNYQIDVIDWMLRRSACLNALDAGLGKTFCAICNFTQLYKQNEIDGIIIIVPIGLSFHWLRQILEFVNVFYEDDIQIINNEEKIQPFDRFKHKKILIIRQDLIANVIASYKKNYNSLKSLKNIRWNIADFVNINKEWNKNNLFLIIDESHAIKHLTSIKTKAIFSIKKYFKYRVLLTATPAINGFEDIYSSIKFIDNSIIKFNENTFKLWISNSIGNKWDKYAINSYNTENVAKVMHNYRHIFIQMRKEELDEVKTKKIIKEINCDLTYIQKKLYKKIIEQEIQILESEYDIITWRLLLNKIHLILEVFDNPLLLKSRHYNDPELNILINQWDIEDDPKFIYLKNRVKEICNVQNKKLIIYDIHPITLNLLKEKLKKYNPLLVHGDLKIKDKEKDRQEKQDLFNYDEKYKIILLSLYTSSAGINLQCGSSNIIINTLAWDATLFRQAQDRIYRINSKYDSLIEVLYYPLSIDNLRTKRNFNRIELNSKMDQELTQNDLNKLLKGIIY